MPMTAEELAGLSDEERAALAEGDDEDLAALKQIVGDKDDEGEDGGADKDADKGADKDAGKDAAAEKPAAEDDSATETPAAEEQEPGFVAQYHSAPVEDYAVKVAAIETRRAEALQQFKDGDIDAEEFSTQIQTVESELRVLDRAQVKAEISAEATKQAAEQEWAWEIKRFMRDTATREGIDYRVDLAQQNLIRAQESKKAEDIAVAQEALRRTRRLNAALDVEVKAISQEPESEGKTSVWCLHEAHRRLKADFGLGKKATVAKPADSEKADLRRKPDLKVVPPNLGSVPAAGGADDSTGGGEFAHLDNLEGMELENALAAMSRADQDRYLRAG